MSTEKNPWLMTPEEHKEWEAELSRKLAAEHATPEYQQRQKDIDELSNCLGVMLYPAKSPTHPRKRSIVHSMGHTEKMDEVCEDFESTMNNQARASQAFRWYGNHFRSKSQDEIAMAGGLAKLGIHHRLLIENAHKAFSWPLKVGASLYIYQQMYDRGLSDEPSLSKAQWLVTNAPLTENQSTNRVSRGDPRKIGDQWKNYFMVSHYWAAFVALTKTPLEYSETALLDFICYANTEEFTRLTASFLDFRKRVEVAFSASTQRRLPYIKQELHSYPLHLEDVVPKLPRDIPNPMTDFQWDALSQYQSHLRKAVR